MYLSKLILDRRRWDVIRDLEDRDLLHKKIMKLFPEIPGGPCDNARQRHGVLYRVENSSILMQSKIAPRTDRRLPGYDLVGTKNIEANYRAVRPGIVYMFRIDANTSIQVQEGDGADWIPEVEDSSVKVRRRTRRVGCGNYQARSRWFESMCGRSGMTPQIYFMETLSPLRVRQGFLEITRFVGKLTISELDVFTRTLQEGVGQGKSYGLGLLSIRNA